MKSILQNLSLPVIFISFLIGLIFIHLSTVSQEVILVHPTPENVGQIEYSDRVGTCFMFEDTLVECPKNGGKLIPIQE